MISLENRMVENFLDFPHCVRRIYFCVQNIVCWVCILNAKLLSKHQENLNVENYLLKENNHFLAILKINQKWSPFRQFIPPSTDQGGHNLVISFAFLCITVLDIWPRDKWVTIVISITLIFADNHHQCLASRHFIPE